MHILKEKIDCVHDYFVVRAYFRHEVRAVTAAIDFFLSSPFCQFACCLGLFHLRIALNLLICVLFINTACMPHLLKIYPGHFQDFAVAVITKVLNISSISVIKGQSLLLLSIFLQTISFSPNKRLNYVHP